MVIISSAFYNTEVSTVFACMVAKMSHGCLRRQTLCVCFGTFCAATEPTPLAMYTLLVLSGVQVPYWYCFVLQESLLQIVAAATFAVVAAALDSHVNEASRRGWTLPTQLAKG